MWNQERDKQYDVMGHPSEAVCATCQSLDKTRFFLDIEGHMVCADCLLISDVDGKVYCRSCAEKKIGSKLFAKVLIGIVMKIEPSKLQKFAMMRREDMVALKDQMIAAGLLAEKRSWPFVNFKPSWEAVATAKTLFRLYKKDGDFAIFCNNIREEVGERWRELTGE